MTWQYPLWILDGLRDAINRNSNACHNLMLV
jgi:hypothetical protein